MAAHVQKRQLDMLHGSIWDKLPRFALPVAATAILEQLFNASDVAVVGNFTGAERTAAVAAVGANSPIIGLIVNLFIGIALGTNVVIAHAIGHGDRETVTKAVHTFVLVSVLGGALVALLGELAAAPLLGLLNVPEDVFPLALLYGRLRRTTQEIRLEPKKLRIDPAILKRILRIGLPAGIQSAVFALSNIVIQSAINSLGTVVMAASSAAFNIEIITYDILNSFSQACTTFVGQNFGAGELRRCKKTLALCLIEGIITLAAAITVILFFGKSLLAIFNNDPEVVATGYIRLVMVMLAHSFSLLYEIMSGYLRGFGISLVPALLTMLGVCGIRIGWIQWVFPQSQTFQTIMTVYPISLSVTALLIFAALVYYRPSRRFAAMGKR